MILGITGTNGAGKGTVVEYLVREKGYLHYSVRDAITEEIERRGLPVNRTTLNEVGTDLRRKFGPTYHTDRFFELITRKGVTDAVIESIRNPYEAKNIQEHGGFMWVVDADKERRYQRIQKRATETDKVSFEEFEKQEEREMTSEDPSDPSYMDIRAIFTIADARIVNDDSLEALEEQIESALQRFSS